jgi:hypothetical protein
MALECPKCGRLNPETSRRCHCGQDLPTVAVQTDTAPQATPPKQEPKDYLPRRCPLCQGANIRTDGWTGLEARVQFGRRSMGVGDSGYGLACFACLDCGYVGHYLCPEDLQTLRSVPIMPNWPPASTRRFGCFGMVLLVIALGVGACVIAGRLLAG